MTKPLLRLLDNAPNGGHRLRWDTLFIRPATDSSTHMYALLRGPHEPGSSTKSRSSTQATLSSLTIGVCCTDEAPSHFLTWIERSSGYIFVR